MNNKFCDFLNCMVDKPLIRINHSLDLICFGFGGIIYRINRKNKLESVPEISLHVQCDFQLYSNNKLILKYDDVYKLNDLFDKKIVSLDRILQNEYVRNIYLTEFGELIIEMSNAKICVHPDKGSNDESWRIFKPTQNMPHLVCSGSKLEFQ